MILSTVGKIINLALIPDADRIVLATAQTSPQGGKWRGVVKKGQFALGDHCIVYLQDAQIPPCEELKFMENSGWRVRVQRFRGQPSECLIVPLTFDADLYADLTERLGVKKYHKPMPVSIGGNQKGPWPSFLSKTDEWNWQQDPTLAEEILAGPHYATEKLDGMSGTAFRYKGEFGICSRNFELYQKPSCPITRVVKKYRIEEILQEGVAIQFEVCGPKIQGNSLGLNEIEGFVFNVFDIENQLRLDLEWTLEFFKQGYSHACPMPMVPIVPVICSGGDIGLLGQGKSFFNQKVEREGVVVRDSNDTRRSFKILNIDYKG